MFLHWKAKIGDSVHHTYNLLDVSTGCTYHFQVESQNQVSMAIFIPSDRSMTIRDHTEALKVWQKLYRIAGNSGDKETAEWIHNSVIESGIPVLQSTNGLHREVS